MALALPLLALGTDAAATPRLSPCGFADGQGICDGSAAWQPAGHELRRGNRDQDRARDAFRSGDVLPLSRILSGVRRQYPGKLLDAALAQQGRGYVYVIKMLGSDNRVRLIYVDAQTGGVLSVR